MIFIKDIMGWERKGNQILFDCTSNKREKRIKVRITFCSEVYMRSHPRAKVSR